MWYFLAWLVIGVVLGTVDASLLSLNRDSPLRGSRLALFMHPFVYLERGCTRGTLSDDTDWFRLLVESIFWPVIMLPRLVGVAINIYHGWLERRAKRLAAPVRVIKPLADMTVQEVLAEWAREVEILERSRNRCREIKLELQERHREFEATIEASAVVDSKFSQLLVDGDELTKQFLELEAHESHRSAKA